MKKTLILVLCGIGAGFINGLMGSGGGIVIVFVLCFLYPEKSVKDAFASALLCILPMSLVSAGRYLQNGSFDIKELLPYIIPAILGGILGGFLLDRLNSTLVKKLFAGLITLGGILILVR